MVNSDCSSGGTKYKLDSCASGYDKSGNSCVKKTCAVKTCEGYTLSTCPTGANCSTCTIANSDCTTGATMYKITSCKSGYTAMYADVNHTIIHNCRKSGGLIGNLTPVTGGLTCSSDQMLMTCGINKCCCPKDKGCDTNSLRKWCYCERSDALAE